MKRIMCAAAIAAALTVTACGSNSGDNHPKSQSDQVREKQKNQRTYIPHNDVELDNYNRAQKLYDDPNTIIWCSTTWGNPSAPIVTVPITGKLTSSSTTFFSPTKWVDRGNYSWTEVSQPSVDGLYHPNPPQYRYGFTPGGQYVDFFNMPTVCTTALTKFQRQETTLTTQVDPEGARLTAQAEAALKAGDKQKAQNILEALGGGS